MATCSVSQYASNMLRRMFFVLPLCGLLAVCSSTTIRQDARFGVSVPIDCGEDENSAACATRLQQIERGGERTLLRVPRQLDGGPLGHGEGEVEEVSSRKKKDKGYWKLLLYFLGAGKVTMLYVLVNTIAAIAGKALIMGKVALAIATAIALKKSFEHKENIAYEIVKHPYHSFEHTHSSSIDFDHHGGFGEHELAYRKRRRIFH